MEKPEYILTRADFDCDEAWARHCHMGGLDPEIDGRGRLVPHLGQGPYGQLRNGIHGWTPGRARPTRRGPSKTNGITLYDVKKFYRGLAFAAWKSCFLNSHVTVTWSLVGVRSDLAMTNAHQRLVDLMHRWLDRHNPGRAYFVWVIERGSLHGLHSHIMVHLHPADVAAFRTWLGKAVARISRNANVPKAVYVRVELSRGSEAQWKHWAPYFLKGSDGTWALSGFKHSDEGPLTGKRVGVARSLDEAAQRRTAFPRGRANIATIEGDPFDGRFDGGERGDILRNLDY